MAFHEIANHWLCIAMWLASLRDNDSAIGVSAPSQCQDCSMAN